MLAYQSVQFKHRQRLCIGKGVVIYRVPENAAGQRIDNFLFNHYKSIPKSRVLRAIRKGEVRVNSKRVGHFYKLSAGEALRLPPLRVDTLALSFPSRIIDFDIVYEDHDILVLNKPSMLAVHAGSQQSHGVIDYLKIQRPDIQDLYLAHRLDKPVTGCLLLAKSRKALHALLAHWNAPECEKWYEALVFGSMHSDMFDIATPLKEVNTGKLQACHSQVYRKYLLQPDLSFCRIRLMTGRKHQIRRHLAEKGYPIVGDERFGDFHKNKVFQQTYQAKGLFLHCAKVRFYHLKGYWKEVSCPWLEDKHVLLQSMRT